VFLLSFRNNDRNRATQSSAVTQKRSSRSNVTLLSSATINSLCRKDNRRIDDDTVLVNKTQPSQRRRQRQPPQQQTATLLLQQPWRSKPRCSAAMLDNSVRQFHAVRFLLLCSHSFCYSARVLCDNQPNLSRRQQPLSPRQPYAKPIWPSQFAFIMRPNVARLRPIRFFQATNGPADRPM
jgi:hypothetical protein